MEKSKRCSFEDISIDNDNNKNCESLQWNIMQLTNNNPDTKICTSQNNKIYQNCAVKTLNPWLTVDYTNDTCSVARNTDLPNGFTYDQDKDRVKKPDRYPAIFDKKQLCHERWYDWFLIPDYFHGNKYLFDTNTNKCYKPCEIGLVPYGTEFQKCIPKNQLAFGMYSNQLHYTPLQLVLLLGHTKKSLLEQHGVEMKKYLEKLSSSKLYEVPKELNILAGDTTKIKDIHVHNIAFEISNDFRDRIRTIVNMIVPGNIVEPINIINNKSSMLHTTERIKQAYDIAKTVLEYEKDEDKTRKNQYLSSKEGGIFEIPEYDNEEIQTNHYHILLKACDMCFNGKTHYSNNILLYKLNEKNINSADILGALNFDLSKTMPVLPPQRNVNENEITVINGVDKSMKKKEDIDDEVIDDFESSKYVRNSMDIFKSLISVIFFILFCTLLTLIIQSVWGHIANIINTAIEYALGIVDIVAVFALGDTGEVAEIQKQIRAQTRKYDYIMKYLEYFAQK